MNHKKLLITSNYANLYVFVKYFYEETHGDENAPMVHNWKHLRHLQESLVKGILKSWLYQVLECNLTLLK